MNIVDLSLPLLLVESSAGWVTAFQSVPLRSGLEQVIVNE